VKGQRLEVVAILASLFFVVYCLALVVFMMTGCSSVESAGGAVTEFVACPVDLIDCGHVYLCEQPADNELGHVEVCIDDDTDGQLDAAERTYGACLPTPRHQGLCSYHCDSGKGCNALTGCYCPP
jgi:hypothetical protein